MAKHTNPQTSIQAVVDAFSAEGIDAKVVKHSDLEWHGVVELDEGRYAEIVAEPMTDALETMFMERRQDKSFDHYLDGSRLMLNRGDDIAPFVQALKADIAERGYSLQRPQPKLSSDAPTREQMLDAVTEQARTIDAPRDLGF
jgi:hypothetical protein